MKGSSIIAVLTALSSMAFAQEKPGSSLQSTHAIITSGALPDSLLSHYYRIDSIRSAFCQQADSIRTEYENVVSAIDSRASSMIAAIDSLSRLQMPTGRYTRRLDSLNQVRQNFQQKLHSRLEDLKSKTTGKLNALDLPPQYKEPLQQLTSNINGIDLNADLLKIPALDLTGFSPPDIDGLGDLTSKAGEIANTAASDFALPGPAGQIAGTAKAYQEDLKNITQGNLEALEALPRNIEAQAARLEGVQELQKQSGVIDQYESQLGALKDPAGGKEKAVELAKKIAIDHFAGKEEKLKAAMEKIAGYKQKYESVSSIRDLPKRPPNPMKNKPFIERLVPGLYFQYQQKGYNLFDLNPHLGYKITGRLSAGAGWNYRIAYDRRTHSLSAMGKIFGPRAYADFNLGKGFIGHLESEVMNTFVPSVLNGNPEVGHREWVWALMTGMKKEYTIYRNLRGTVLIQYNLFNPEYKAPYVDRWNSRIGFEYQLKRKKKAMKKSSS